MLAKDINLTTKPPVNPTTMSLFKTTKEYIDDTKKNEISSKSRKGVSNIISDENKKSTTPSSSLANRNRSLSLFNFLRSFKIILK